MNEVAKRVIQNTGFLYGRMLISIFIILYTTRLVLNTLGESDFGIFNVVGGVIALLSFVSASASARRFCRLCRWSARLFRPQPSVTSTTMKGRATCLCRSAYLM